MGFIHHVKEEFQIIQERDPSIKSPWEVLLYPRDGTSQAV